jgi:hypothetical protein
MSPLCLHLHSFICFKISLQKDYMLHIRSTTTTHMHPESPRSPPDLCRMYSQEWIHATIKCSMHLCAYVYVCALVDTKGTQLQNKLKSMCTLCVKLQSTFDRGQSKIQVLQLAKMTADKQTGGLETSIIVGATAAAKGHTYI